MRKSTNNIKEVFKAANEEVAMFKVKESEKILAYFQEQHAYAGYPFRIFLIEDKDGLIYTCFRQWDTEYDLKRKPNDGTFALDGLSIITEEKKLSNEQQKSIIYILDSINQQQIPQSINSTEGLVIHSTTWSFGIYLSKQQNEYEWRAASDDIKIFEPIIDLMLEQHKKINKRG